MYSASSPSSVLQTQPLRDSFCSTPTRSPSEYDQCSASAVYAQKPSTITASVTNNQRIGERRGFSIVFMTRFRCDLMERVEREFMCNGNHISATRQNAYLASGAASLKQGGAQEASSATIRSAV